MGGAALTLTVAPTILLQLFINRVEQFSGNNRGHGHADPLLFGPLITDARSAGNFRTPALGTQSGMTFTKARLSIGRQSAVCRIPKDPTHRRGFPLPASRARENPLLFQPAAHPANRTLF